MKKRDIILLIIIIIILVSILILTNIRKTEGKTLRIYKDNEIIEELDLSKDRTKEFVFDDEINIVEIIDNKVNVIEANCDNQICVNTASISNVGESIACLPHMFIVEIAEN